MRSPSQVYQPSTRKYRGGVEHLDYPQMLTRRINQNGKINWENHQLFISSSLAGWSVGLKPTVQHGELEVWFARLLLGWIDSHTVSFQRGDLHPKSDLKSVAGSQLTWGSSPNPVWGGALEPGVESTF